MYKLLLCWKYLRTRYLAMVCIVSVMLGVATLIVVNSVMGGFSTKLKERLHGLLSDVVLEAYDYDGFTDAPSKMAQIRNDPFLSNEVEAMTATLEIFAMLQFNFREVPFTRPVRIIGIEPEGRKAVGGFAEHLVNPKNHEKPTFNLDENARERFIIRRASRGIDFPGPREAPNLNEPPPPDPPPSKPH